MDLVPLDEQRQLFISPSIDDWKSIEDHGITAVITAPSWYSVPVRNESSGAVSEEFR